MKLKRFCVFLLVIILCLCNLSSCFIVINKDKFRKEPESTESESTEEVTTTADTTPTPTLPKDSVEIAGEEAEALLESQFSNTNYEGITLTVAYVDYVSMDIKSDGETSYSIQKERQSGIIRGYLGCDIAVKTAEFYTFMQEAQISHNAGLYYADLVSLPQRNVGYLVAQGMLVNLYELNGNNALTEDYYNESSKAHGGAGNTVYAIAGNANISPNHFSCVYFNKDIIASNGLTDSVYRSVADGSWTLEKMFEIYKVCSPNLDICCVGNISNEALTETLFAASGMKYMETGIGNTPVIASNGDRITNFISYMKDLIKDTVQCYTGDEAQKLFEEGKVLFHIDTLDKCVELKKTYGIMPLPKYDSEQDGYYTYVNDNAPVFCILKSSPNPEAAFDLMKAYNITGKIVAEAFKRDLLDYIVGDYQSAKNARMIMDIANYDFAYMYYEKYETVGNSTIYALRNAVNKKTTYNYYVTYWSYRFKNEMKKLFPVG